MTSTRKPTKIPPALPDIPPRTPPQLALECLDFIERQAVELVAFCKSIKGSERALLRLTGKVGRS